MSQQQEKGMKRRRFLWNSAIGVLGAGVMGTGSMVFPGEKKESTQNSIFPKIKTYRTLGRTGFKASDIGIGDAWNEGILNAALDTGVNYIDTAEAYHNGQSERAIGKALKNRNRKEFFITTKLGIRGTESKENLLSRARKCLERLQTDYIDCMMIWGASSIKEIKYPPFHEAMKQLKQEGKLRFVGAACHGTQWRDNAVTMDKILLTAAADGRYDLFLFVYNFMQKEMGERILKVCQEKNIGVTLMKTNPVGGYLLARERSSTMKERNPELMSVYKRILPRLKAKSQQAREFLKLHHLENPSEIRAAAIKFVLSHPGVHSVCCTMDSFDDMEAFIKLSGSTLNREELKKLSVYRQGCSEFYCRHACGICEGHCPYHVPVNTIMRYNHYFEAQKREKHAMQKYARLKTTKPDKCLNCRGYCETACPYHVPIQGLLIQAHQTLTLV